MVKKLLLIVSIVALLCSPALARRYNKVIVPNRATDSNMPLSGGPINGQTFGKGTLEDRPDGLYSKLDLYIKAAETIYTQPINVQDASDLNWALSVHGMESGANISVEWEVSLDDGVNFISPVNASGTDQTARLVDSLTQNTYVLFTGARAQDIRFVVSATTASMSTIEFIYQTAD